MMATRSPLAITRQSLQAGGKVARQPLQRRIAQGIAEVVIGRFCGKLDGDLLEQIRDGHELVGVDLGGDGDRIILEPDFVRHDLLLLLFIELRQTKLAADLFP
jgi:hypothetical protein